MEGTVNDAGAGHVPVDSGTVLLPQHPPVLVPGPQAQPSAGPVVHLVELREVGPFTTAWCTGCDWRSFARRSRPLARGEGDDHARLYAPSPMGQGS
jgi:hypothetical protein